VIGAGLLASAAGTSDRRVAETLAVPAATVRGWRRRAGARTERLRALAWRWALDCDPCLPVPDPTGSDLGDALNILGLAAAAIVHRLGIAHTAAPWRLIAVISHGQLLGPVPDY
jgi:hypothetical protein